MDDPNNIKNKTMSNFEPFCMLGSLICDFFSGALYKSSYLDRSLKLE